MELVEANSETILNENGTLTSRNEALAVAKAEKEAIIKEQEEKIAKLSRKDRKNLRTISILKQSMNDASIAAATDSIYFPDSLFITEVDTLHQVDSVYVMVYPTYSGLFSGTNVGFDWSVNSDSLSLTNIDAYSETTLTHSTRTRFLTGNQEHSVTATSDFPWSQQSIQSYNIESKPRRIAIIAGIGPSVMKFRKGAIKYGQNLDPQTTVTTGWSAGIFLGYRIW
jgi:hypothetical protein